MKTIHSVFFLDSSDMTCLSDESIDLVVTSPPYPMIEMWDTVFENLNPAIHHTLKNGEGYTSFTLMHAQLEKTWIEVCRVLRPGGIVCINIGDATRKVGENFSLFPNHSVIIQFFMNAGFFMLPTILWKKQSNKPNKFMGSGMMPPNAYVTLEHEYILIFRKGGIRTFSASQKEQRYQSSYFWEERNCWFSDIWENIKGIGQDISNAEPEKDFRKRSAAYPVEIPLRLINMYSVQGDTVLDPFLGTGTTSLAAISSGRNSVGFEKDSNFDNLIRKKILYSRDFNIIYTENRLASHEEFILRREQEGKVASHFSKIYGFPVITSQEVKISIPIVDTITETESGLFEVTHRMPSTKVQRSSELPKNIPKISHFYS